MMSTITIPWLAGYIPDLPTPFDEAGRVDVNALARLCERQIAAGVSAIVVCETAGEASTLSPAEQEFVIRAAVDIRADAFASLRAQARTRPSRRSS